MELHPSYPQSERLFLNLYSLSSYFFSLEYMRYSMNPVQAYSRIFLSIFAILLHFHIPRKYPLVAYFCILLNIFISVCDYKKQVRDGTASLLRSQRRDSWLYYPIWIYDCLGLLAGPNRSVADRFMAVMLAGYFAAVVFWFGADAFWDVVHALQDGFDGYLTD
ncbi:hypothetical protein EYC84_007152 [Monilinia fructicola]|uniref:Uncharacterized protein n=1 Tax=Monilinia fructicola TaxID=38448 RepID=A0A5M9K5Q1_MONFR|nr:hypothetical protein EYC84_007152 [Monilinia fructicola]